MSEKRVTSVAGRLALLLCGLAAVSTGVALLLQDRGLDQELRRSARDRLAVSAAATGRMIADHLANLGSRYAAISRTPELRANLASGHIPTLSYYASQLLREEDVSLVGFVRRDGEMLAAAGDPRLTETALAQAMSPDSARVRCVTARDPRAEQPDSVDPWKPCMYPSGGPETSLFESRGELYALITVPLRTGPELAGGFLVVDAVDEAMLARWSDLSGATIHIGAGGIDDADLASPVTSVPGVTIYASTTYDDARATIRRARANIVASGVFALFLALGASLFLGRAFARPIIEIREATARLSEGDLASRVRVDRDDEIGQLGQAFNELASQLTDSQERVRLAERLARFGNWYFDFETQTFDGTNEFRRLLDLQPTGAIPVAAVLDRIRPGDRDALDTVIRASRRSSTPFRLDVRVRDPDGRDRILQLRGHTRNRTTTRMEGSVQDVTDRREAEEQIQYLSRHDALTGLGNRDQAMEDLSERTLGRAGEETFALLMIGVDDLQSITDTFGHAIGDHLLVDIAQRLVASVRRDASDRAEAPDLVSRLGDERFAAVLEGVRDADGATIAAERLLATVRGSYRVGENEITVTTSAGIALWPADGDDGETLLRNAETALTRVQRGQPGGTRFFHESMHTDATRRIQIASRLRRALDEGALELHYQPRVRPDTGALVGFEGLARWTDPELGVVSPGEFIPIAEATGTIGQLGAWCIEAAARQLAAWHERGHTELTVSVNLSSHQLAPKLVDRVLAATEGLDHGKFELEVTESALIEEGDAAIETLTSLRAHGFRIALDDFGTGYSSLSYLQGLPLDTVKVDRGFIRHIAEDADAAALTGSVLAMCQALRLHTVVEGVETQAQLDVLVGLGYPEAQGFFFAKPMPAHEADVYLERAPQTAGRDSEVLKSPG